ncbi:TraG family conjugative transposon ATPase [Prevotella melaninogenica]|uniref:TraG family conjugative transposon ATPase n=1 Tax=Prevotella melaninogenica TaxID=28132 RepID=A0ABS6Y738_9BACT|nr:TraG family conjugative transposon ATPase [Prevotella melaninogenica]MBW4754415.1 TraG family conjugative transposon ATPase [Prevotella melaninogenica]
MVSLVAIFCLCSILLGMALSVRLFGTGGKRAKIFSDIYYSIEDAGDFAVVYTKKGDFSAVIKMTNPVRKYSADIDGYYSYNTLFNNILQTLGTGFALHKQDVFVRRRFDMMKAAGKDTKYGFLTSAYLKFFSGRLYTDVTTYLVITQNNKKTGFSAFDEKVWRTFKTKVAKVMDQLHDGGIKASFLGVDECRDYADRFFAVNFRDEVFSMTDFKVDNESIRMGNRHCKIYSLLDVDDVGLPGSLRPYTDLHVNNTSMPVDLLSAIDSIPGADTVVYNQVIFIPNQKSELSRLDKVKNRHASLPSPGNQVSVEDIKKVQEIIAREGKQLVYSHYNMIVAAPATQDLQKITNHLENIFDRQGIHLSRRAYNQLELFVSSFPGNCFQLNKDYDRFLTLSEAALCLMYKESQVKGDESPLKCWYTDRQGVPLAVDTTGKEGKVKYTDNSNFFVLGPSGSGKSFFMNTVMRQYYEQDTDCVIVDTGDSYEGLCNIFEGTYISYSKERPISMNPFKVTEAEYNENFNEKKGFLRSLIFLIFKGNEAPTILEETIINQTIIEYYQEFFTPFEGYTEEERKTMRDLLLLVDKKNGEYEKYENELEKLYESEANLEEPDEEIEAELRRREDKRNRDRRLRTKLQNVIDDSAATEGEKESALTALQRLTPEVVEGKYLARINKRIDRMEQRRKKLRVKELSFNTYYEYVLERIPQIMREQNILFDIDNFAAILKPFYKGGEMEVTLNNDMDSSLFDEKFIVFEIDKVKDDPVLFPIIVLIIMDVFTQKMRIKKGRKCLVIEEAWKAIATPTMAEYIKYLYKTARKHWAMVGVVTQEIEDVTSSEIVKEAIINNSDVFMLLDQNKYKEKFDKIKTVLALTDIDCKKIFTINRLDNKADRSAFKEVYIKRGITGDVYGVEEPRECYMAYTTEKAEKEALKLYKRMLSTDYQHAIEAFCRDWERSGIKKSLEFSKKVLAEGKPLNLQKSLTSN